MYDSITIGADNGDGDTGKNLMGSGGERTQHRSGLVAICGFAEDPPSSATVVSAANTTRVGLSAAIAFARANRST